MRPSLAPRARGGNASPLLSEFRRWPPLSILPRPVPRPRSGHSRSVSPSETPSRPPAREALLDDAFGPRAFRNERAPSSRPYARRGLALVARHGETLVGTVRLWNVQRRRRRALLLGPLAVREVAPAPRSRRSADARSDRARPSARLRRDPAGRRRPLLRALWLSAGLTAARAARPCRARALSRPELSPGSLGDAEGMVLRPALNAGICLASAGPSGHYGRVTSGGRAVREGPIRGPGVAANVRLGDEALRSLRGIVRRRHDAISRA